MMNVALVVALVILKIIFLVNGAPVETQTSIESTTTQSPNCHNEDGDIYDQRQNGTENYRIHVNGVVVFVAPTDAILQAAQLSNLPLETELTGITSGSQVLKPKPRPPSPTDKVPNEEIQQPPQPPPSDQTTDKDKNLNILNFLGMFRSLRPNLVEVKQLRQV